MSTRRLEPGDEAIAEEACRLFEYTGPIDVAEHARGRGHARALVITFVEHARAVGCAEVWVLAGVTRSGSGAPQSISAW